MKIIGFGEFGNGFCTLCHSTPSHSRLAEVLCFPFLVVVWLASCDARPLSSLMDVLATKVRSGWSGDCQDNMRGSTRLAACNAFLHFH